MADLRQVAVPQQVGIAGVEGVTEAAQHLSHGVGR